MHAHGLRVLCISTLWIAGCHSQEGMSRDLEGADLSTADGAAPEDLAVVEDLKDGALPAPDLTSVDLTPPCLPQTLLDGSSTPEVQGWSAAGTTPSAVSSDGVLINFNTKAAPRPDPNHPNISPFILYTKNIGISDGTPYALEWRLKVVTTDGHNPSDAPVAFLASASTTGLEDQTQRNQMIYFDVGAVGWADNQGSSYAVDTTNALHVYRLDVTAAGHAEVRVDGTLALSRDSFTTNGVIAVGDQTNDPNVDSQFSVYTIRKLCP